MTVVNRYHPDVMLTRTTELRREAPCRVLLSSSITALGKLVRSWKGEKASDGYALQLTFIKSLPLL